MDPKTPANLDPKLKEVYERVMGTPTAPSSSAVSQEPPAPPQPQEQEPPSQPIAPAPAETQPVSQNAPAVQKHEEQPTHPFPKNSFVANQAKTGSNLMPLIIVGLLIFFAAYTIFWLKFFNITLIPLPF